METRSHTKKWLISLEISIVSGLLGIYYDKTRTVCFPQGFKEQISLHADSRHGRSWSPRPEDPSAARKFQNKTFYKIKENSIK